MNMARALWHVSPQGSEIKEESESGLFTGAIMVKSLFSLVSTGTERCVARGECPTSLRDSMKVPYMGGDFGFPLKYGYSLVGEVVSPGHPSNGKHVHVMHPHQDFCFVRTNDIFLIPEGIPLQRATLASNLETALNAIWDAHVSIGDKVLLVGFGMIGALVARLLSMLPAMQFHIIETDARRVEEAIKMGFSASQEAQERADFDIAFHTSASEAGLQTCIELVGKEGKVIELSWYGNKIVNISLGSSFHVQRKQIISSQVSTLPACKRVRWDYRRRKEVVFDLLKNSLFDQHISHVIEFEESPDFFEILRNTMPDGLGYAIRY